MSCAGSQDPLDLDMRAMREAALGSHKGERSNKPNDSPDSNYGSSLSSDQTVRMCMSPMPLETVEDAEFKWKECDAAENGLNEKNSIDDSQEDRIVQTSDNSIVSSSSCKSLWPRNQEFRCSGLLSSNSMKTFVLSKSLDRGLNLPTIERGIVPLPPSRPKSVSLECDENEGTPVDGDLDNEPESRQSSPSVLEYYSDDDSHSKSSDDCFEPACFLTSGSRRDSFDGIQKESSWQSNELLETKAATLPRMEGLSSLHLFSPHSVVSRPISHEQRTRSYNRLSNLSKLDGSVSRTKSMDALEEVSCKQAGNLNSLYKQLGNHKPLPRRPSLASAQMQMLLVPQSSVKTSPSLKRSQSPIPKLPRFRIPFRKGGRQQSQPDSPTPTVIPNPFLNSTDNSHSNCRHEASPIFHREVSPSPSVLSHDIQIQARKRASVDCGSVFNMSAPVVQVTGPGQLPVLRSTLNSVPPPYIRVAEVETNDEKIRRRASEPVARNRGMSRLSDLPRASPEVVASHEDFNLCLDDCHESLRQRQHHLCQFATKGWLNIVETGLAVSLQLAKTQKSEQELRQCVWEVCRTECEYFCHLMNARDVYMDTMQKLKAKGHLPTINMDQLFANLTEICSISEKWAESLLSLFKGKSVETAGDILGLLRIFSEFDDVVTGPYCQYSHSYTKLTHLDLLSEWKADSNFIKYLAWCQQRSDRISLDQVLIAPVRRFSDYVILLKEVLKHCPPKYKPELKEKIATVERSVANLNKEVENKEVYNIVAELQHSLRWPSLTEFERPGFFVPPELDDFLEENRSLNFLDNGDRKILYNTPVSLRDASSRMDMFLFLFDDLLLITKFNSKERPSCSRQMFKRLSYGTYTVYKQPLPLDRVQLCSIPSGSGLENALTIVHYSRYMQIIGVYTFQTTSPAEKATWIKNIEKAQANLKDATKLIASSR
ncbi:uncharacterized protein LOC134195340 isoform X2 [Corticium candelabrum]|nr:uncharacterized protein LOC134195340 isoform X2 [Corticium candelabrum]